MYSKITLQPNKQRTIINGHPWIFPKAIASIEKKSVSGDLVIVNTAENEYLGIGVYNSHSLYRVRMLTYAHEVGIDATLDHIIKLRLKQAWNMRQSLNLPNQLTTAYRLFNSEADGLSGLTIDCFNQAYVVSSSAYWVEANKSLIIKHLNSLLASEQIIWRSQKKSLSQDGWTLVEEENKTFQDMVVLESGIKLIVHFDESQKTGLFLDQRENHERIGQLAKGKKVLDLYTYVGGFALHAAKGGAQFVKAIDSSEAAIKQAKINAQENNLTIEFKVEDARNYLAQAGDFDLIILDPPKLVPSRDHLVQAKKYYRFLHRELFKAMKSNSLLMTCNCSSALTTEEFCQLINSQAIAADKKIIILGVYGPAICHPTISAFPEGNYLTAVLVAVC